MKIAQISATFPPYKGGTGSVCNSYALELTKLGNEVTVFTSINRGVNAETESAEFKVKRFNPIFRIGNAPFIPQLLLIEKFDIVHLHYPFFFGAELVFLLYLLKGQKYFITYHNDVLLEGWMGFFLKFYKKLFMGLVLKNAEKICVTSFDYAKNSDLSNLVSEEKIIEISNGLDLKSFTSDLTGKALKKKFGYKSDLLLFVGAMDKAHYFKGVDYLLKSFEKLLSKNKSVTLILIGDGDLKQSYMDLSEKLRISENVKFLGSVSQSKLIEHYKMADVVILPSVNMGEAFGLVLVEGMAFCKPVIASNLPGVRSVVDDNVNGLLVEPKEIDELCSKIEFLLNRSDLRIKMGKEGRKKVEDKYDWPVIVSKLNNAYKEVLE
jgi:glycosyltransferase involved in cell wall biosynthesis